MRKVLISGGAAHEARSWADSLRAAGVESSVVGEEYFVPVIEAGDATVVIVAGDALDPGRDPRLTEAFRLAIRAAAVTSAAPAVWVHLGPGSAPALVPGWQGDVPSGSSAPLADYGPGLAYAEWRNDLFSLTSGVEATYIGWTNHAGRPIVGVLRGAVVSPLAAPPDAEFNWSNCDAGSQCLGEAILADSMGPSAALDGSTGEVVERFVKEIIDRLAPDGFELSSADVRSWLRQYLA